MNNVITFIFTIVTSQQLLLKKYIKHIH